MSDPRITPDPTKVHHETPVQIAEDVVDLLRHPDGPRDRQLIFGDRLTHLGDDGTFAYVQSDKDGYCGYVPREALAPQDIATHWVAAPATHAYEAADFKSRDLCSLSFGSQIRVTSTTDRFAASEIGHLPLTHLKPMGEHFDDPATVAALFLGTPYLWGGNSRWGIDCSGLVQAALLACGHASPGDSDMQQGLGTPASGPYERNDLLFWKGHVALVTDPETLIHANAHAMSTCSEPIEQAITRIKAQGDGPVTAHRRL